MFFKDERLKGRRGKRKGFIQVVNWSDKAVAIAAKRLDDPLLDSIVVECLADQTHAPGQYGIADKFRWPGRFKQFGLWHRAITMHQQMHQHSKGFGFEWNDNPPGAQFSALQV
jgi:hypothetical protein